MVPIINENDTVVTDEIKVGDNDTLGALVTNLIEADVLVILTDQRGLYTADPRKDPLAQFVSEASAGDPALEKWQEAPQARSQGRHDYQDSGGQASSAQRIEHRDCMRTGRKRSAASGAG